MLALHVACTHTHQHRYDDPLHSYCIGLVPVMMTNLTVPMVKPRCIRGITMAPLIVSQPVESRPVTPCGVSADLITYKMVA